MLEKKRVEGVQVHRDGVTGLAFGMIPCYFIVFFIA
jgi:hypothetical protein